jgi:ABC-type transport system substrate-binding protein
MRVSRFLFQCLPLTVLATGFLLNASAGTPKAWAADAYTITATGFKEAKQGGTFYSRLSQYPRGLNSFKSSADVYSNAITELVLESLVDTDMESWLPIPMLAESWETAPDNLSATFKINPNAKWSDGTPVTADDVVFTWDTIFDEKNDTAPTRGYQASVKGAKKIDNLTVKLEFKYPDCENISRAGGQSLMQKSVYSKGKFNDDFNNVVIGSGPYIYDVKNSKKGRKIVLVRNKNWWGKDKAHLKNTFNFDKVIYNVIEDDRVAFESFKKGELSWLQFTGDALDGYAKNVVGNKTFDGSGKFAMLSWPMANPVQWNGIAINMRRPPTDELKFRQAMQTLFNYELFTQKIFHGLQAPLLGPFGNYSDYSSPNRKLVKFDPKAAAQLLKDIGYAKVDSDGILYKEVDGKKQRAEITIMFAYQPHEKYLTIYKEDAKKVGVGINLKFSDWSAATKLVDEFKFDAFVMGWAGNPSPDPSQLWNGKFANQPASSNIPGFNDPAVTKMIEEAPSICEHKSRMAAFHKIEDGIVAAQPYLWRWQQKNHYFVYNKEKLTIAPKIWKYSGSAERVQPWRYWWHPNPGKD